MTNPSEAQIRADDKRVKCRKISRKRLTIRTQLLLAVNLPLLVLMVMLLVADYRQEMQSSIMRKQVGLQEEALTIAHGLSCLSQQGRAEPIQRFVDRVCAGMQETRSPGHHIAVRVGDNVVQAQAHHRASPEMLQAMRNAARSPGSHALLGDVTLVVGSFSANDVEVYVSENTTDIRQSIHNEMLSHSISLAALGVVAAGIVNVVLLRLVVRPLQQLSGAVARIAQGDYAVQTNAYRSHELIGLSEAIRQMASTLANNEQERHLQMDRARKIQDHLLPNGVEIPGLAVAHYFQPADSVAGDYYDLMRLRDETWLVCVADVTGHGVAAAMGSVMLKALVMHAIEHDLDPRHILQFVNHRLPGLLPSEFITMFLARWDPVTHRLEYASAGHEPGLLVSQDGDVQELPATGLPLGVDSSFEWETVAITMSPGQRLVLTTDGIAESRTPAGELFGRKRLADVASNCKECPPHQIVKAIRDAMLSHQQGRRSADDVTILVIEADAVELTGD